jgi:hypothetical protein
VSGHLVRMLEGSPQPTAVRTMQARCAVPPLELISALRSSVPHRRTSAAAAARHVGRNHIADAVRSVVPGGHGTGSVSPYSLRRRRDLNLFHLLGSPRHLGSHISGLLTLLPQRVVQML